MKATFFTAAGKWIVEEVLDYEGGMVCVFARHEFSGTPGIFWRNLSEVTVV